MDLWVWKNSLWDPKILIDAEKETCVLSSINQTVQFYTFFNVNFIS
jgi:hypothetical protein